MFAAFAEDDEDNKKTAKTATKADEPKKEEGAHNAEEKSREGRGRGRGRYRARGPRPAEGETHEGTYERRGRGRGRGGRYRHDDKEEEITAEGKLLPKKEGMEARRFVGDRDQVHPFDRHSGTGTLKPEVKKGGHGKFNTGKPEDDVKEGDKVEEEGNKEYRKDRRPRKYYDEKEGEDTKKEPEPETISYKDILKAKTKEEPKPVVVKKEVPKVDNPLVTVEPNKEVKKITKNFTEDMHGAALEGETSKFANLKISEKYSNEEKKPVKPKAFVFNDTEFPALC
jgi:hypothetical protein